ncbi:hypothetical protein PMAYCL1PPCAC_04281, partial [Pristionchus mayeri]
SFYQVFLPPMDHDSASTDRRSFYARAQHAFRGKNNDELSFGIGDVIAITQQVEGGWWEGTLNGDTGWFPSGYVTMIADKESLMRSRSIPNVADSSGVNGMNPSDGSFTQKQFISQVLDSFLKAEGDYILSLQNIIENYLAPLSSSNVVTQSEFNTIEGEISKIYAMQASILVRINEMQGTDLSQQRIGGVLISSAPELKQELTAYCSNHPDAVELITLRMHELDAFFKSLSPPGDMRTFIQGLSEPFRHIKSYSPVLQELHRNMPESHADRGDIQRSVIVYRDLMELCEWVRRQREVQSDFLRTRRVSLFARDEQPGRIYIVGGASVSRGEEEAEDRTVALFDDYIAVFEMTSNGEDYQLREMVKVEGLRTRRAAGKHAIVTNPVPEEVTFAFPSSYDVDRWIDALQKARVPVEEETNGKASTPTPSSAPRGLETGPPVAVTMRRDAKKATTTLDESLDQMDAALRANSFEFARMRNKNASQQHHLASTPTSSTSSSSLRKPKTPLDDSLPFRVNHELEMIMPDGFDDDDRGASARRNESAFYMRHYPPFRSPNNMVDLGKRGVKMRKDQSSARDHGDAALLAIVEGYLGVGGEEKERGGGSLARGDQQPQLIVAEDEKLLIEETVDGQTVMTEKSLVDVVYALKDQMDRMGEEMASLRSAVEKEQRARRRLEDSIKRSSLQLSTSTPKPLLDTSN